MLFGSNAANNQPVALKYLHYAKKNGAQIAVVNPHREPGLERYWIPSTAESALGGTALADHWFDVDTGGDRAFLVGALRVLIDRGGVDENFLRERTEGFDRVRLETLAIDWTEIERESGASKDRIEAFAHAHGVETIRALVNVGLARGLVGRRQRGLVPIRGHSGVQGGAEVGCLPNVDAATRERWAEVWKFPVPQSPGWTAAEMVERASRGDVDVFWNVGGNFLETLPDASVRARH